MRFFDTVALELSDRGFDTTFSESVLIKEIHDIVVKTFPSEPKTVSFIMNDPDFVGDVLDVLGAI
jgi:hypothetical protein